MSGDPECALGHVVWHSSEEGAGPDVGISIGLGGGKSLWVGEITRDAWDELSADEKSISGNDDLGWWAMILPGDMPLARFVSGDAAREFSDAVEAALAAAKP
jgi:hypothetical protein